MTNRRPTRRFVRAWNEIRQASRAASKPTPPPQVLARSTSPDP